MMVSEKGIFNNTQEGGVTLGHCALRSTHLNKPIPITPPPSSLAKRDRTNIKSPAFSVKSVFNGGEKGLD